MSRQFIDYSIAMVTPFNQEGEFLADSVAPLTQFYINQLKAPGLLVSGSTGEQHCLSLDERKQLYKIVGETAPKGFPLYAGVAAFKTKYAIELAQAAEQAGFSGIMLGVPPYRRPLQRELESYVTEVANSIKLPFFLYNTPDSNGCQIEPETFVRLASKLSNLRGLKDVGHPENVPKIQSLLGDEKINYSFFTGNDDEYVELKTNYGYTSITSMAANIFPVEMKQIFDYMENNEKDKAESILNDLKSKIQTIGNMGYVQCIKYILRERGAPAGYCPPPLMDPSEEEKHYLKTFV
ncbi:uncharacterized protein BX663DRAFT_509724 [Cokeromyces recurvatus]|uniref:uncharacterized protein n=1 Tax=Cokeromyces recurvatus TaxID=90255 RepID=UPI00221F6719|nr:uncharacterized protein BX663DRAFT_509724 [Cokeromyces recurvatus]KAI7902581.1 hypothetical protein BX663DRAFT_509724 [Cokeromyces recurvatus]